MRDTEVSTTKQAERSLSESLFKEENVVQTALELDLTDVASARLVVIPAAAAGTRYISSDRPTKTVGDMAQARSLDERTAFIEGARN